jgi:Ca-activated chloride channel homolog
MRPRVLVALVACCAAVTVVLAGEAPRLSILSPTADDVVSGPTEIAVEIAGDAAVQSVRVFANGRVVCTLEQAPFTCAWDAGGTVRSHQVRVVATLTDGRRLVQTVRTKDIGYAERTHVDAVLVPVIVTHRGRFVQGLKRQDFEVLEDGVAQRLTGFADEESPLDLVLALDISGSMEHAIGNVKRAAKGFLGKLRPDDRATIIGFNDTLFLVAERESDQETRERALDLLESWGGTALYDATVRAVELVGAGDGRKGLVVFSDGDDQHSLTPPEIAAARVQAGNGMLYSIGFGAGATVPRLREQLEQYAQATGGRAFFPRHANELDTVFTEIVTELANQYVLAYVSSNTKADGRWRSIRVRVRDGKHEVRARRGYQARAPLRAGREP